jgi:hypothetical protein
MHRLVAALRRLWHRLFPQRKARERLRDRLERIARGD